jgi:hypothetical protein
MRSQSEGLSQEKLISPLIIEFVFFLAENKIRNTNIEIRNNIE